AAELRRGLLAAGLPADRETVAGLHTEAHDQVIRRELEDSLRADLVELGLPMTELPLLPDGVDRAGLAALADALRRAD
ncbi:ATPase, partial [Micromonospora azadirachtae]